MEMTLTKHPPRDVWQLTGVFNPYIVGMRGPEYKVHVPVRNHLRDVQGRGRELVEDVLHPLDGLGFVVIAHLNVKGFHDQGPLP